MSKMFKLFCEYFLSNFLQDFYNSKAMKEYFEETSTFWFDHMKIIWQELKKCQSRSTFFWRWKNTPFFFDGLIELDSNAQNANTVFEVYIDNLWCMLCFSKMHKMFLIKQTMRNAAIECKNAIFIFCARVDVNFYRN